MSLRGSLGKKWVAALLVLLIGSGAASGQSSGTISAHGRKAKLMLARLSPGDEISVIPLQTPEEFGRLTTVGDEEFTFFDVDRRADVTMRYDDVKKVWRGYGGYNSVQRRHTDHHKAAVIATIVIAGLTGLLVLAASHD